MFADRPADEPLFGPWAREVAASQDRDAGFRWVALSDDAEAAGLRAALEEGFARSGEAADRLAKGLAHERWGQHAGARAHLLMLALLPRLGLEVICEPELGGRSPDLLAARGDARALVEVRSLTGCGLEPWDSAPPPRTRGPVRPGVVREKERRRRARAAAIERARAEQARERDLSQSVSRAVIAKLDTYGEAAAAADLPLVVALYQDTDDQLAQIVSDWGLGDGGAVPGAWERAPGRFGDLSAVFVIGRDAGDDGACLLRGELLTNPAARRPLPDGWLPRQLPPCAVA